MTSSPDSQTPCEATGLPSGAVEAALHGASATQRGLLVWNWGANREALSSAPVGGGFSTVRWAVNIGVAPDYNRTDLAEHAHEVAAGLGLARPGIALFTAADVSKVRRSTSDGVVVDATVGVSKPTWAADPAGGYTTWSPGTINIVVQVPVTLEHGAAVNAVVTATEAKAQALGEAGVPGTGTASDAIVVVWPLHIPPARFGGPRSQWGARIASATHSAVRSGLGPTQC